MRRPTPVPRVRFICLVVCLSLLAQSLFFAPAVISVGSSITHTKSPSGVRAEQQVTDAQAADLPDLGAARQLPEYQPEGRRTHPFDAAALPAPQPALQRRPGRRGAAVTDSRATLLPTPLPYLRCPSPLPTSVPAPSPVFSPTPSGQATPPALASSTAWSLLAVVSAAMNGGSSMIDLPLLDYYANGRGYSVSDSPVGLLAQPPRYAPPHPVTAPVQSGTAASFVKADSATQERWRDAYGVDGYNIVGDTSSYPPYAQVSVTGQSSHTWATSSAEARALQKASSQPDRVAATWYSFTDFTIDINLTDGQAHQVALYLLDWDGNNVRSETVEVLNASTGAVLNSRNVTALGGGRYLVWRLKGHVEFEGHLYRAGWLERGGERALLRPVAPDNGERADRRILRQPRLYRI